MIIFEFDEDMGTDGLVYYLGSTHITKEDEEEENCIYEQLTAHESFLDE